MDINQIGQIYSQKLQDINSRIPNTNINNKFQSYLENAKLASTQPEKSETEISSGNSEKASSVDTNTLLSALLTSNLNSSSLMSSSDSSSSIFPTSSMNNSLQMLQQTALLKSLNNKTTEQK